MVSSEEHLTFQYVKMWEGTNPGWKITVRLGMVRDIDGGRRNYLVSHLHYEHREKPGKWIFEAKNDVRIPVRVHI